MRIMGILITFLFPFLLRKFSLIVKIFLPSEQNFPKSLIPFFLYYNLQWTSIKNFTWTTRIACIWITYPNFSLLSLYHMYWRTPFYPHCRDFPWTSRGTPSKHRGEILKVIANPFISSQHLKNPYFSRMSHTHNFGAREKAYVMTNLKLWQNSVNHQYHKKCCYSIL